MAAFSSFSDAQLRAIAELLGDCGTGDDISRVFESLGMVDSSQQSTKWRRLYAVFSLSQRDHRCANHIVAFIQSFLSPVRFVGKSEDFESKRLQINSVLSFSGLEYGPDGTFQHCEVARTLDQAEARVQTIRGKFKGRQIHPEVVKYCKAELMKDNYFHAVFEATKGLAQRIRETSGALSDGAALVDQVFSIERPLLAFNALRTETERSEHRGFASLLKGCFAAVRNPLAHEPKVLWHGEDDAADYLSLISLLHRKLDGCVSTRPGDGR